MKLIVPIKLLTDDLQSQALYNTLIEANKACGYIADLAWQHQVFTQVLLHKLCYKEVRDHFNLGSQITIRCIGKVVESYTQSKKVKPKFRPTGSIAYDIRNLAIKTEKQFVTIWTQLGRIKIKYTSGPQQLLKLTNKIGESDLILRKKQWYLHCSVEVPEKQIQVSETTLGVDLGIKNIAVTSEDVCYSGVYVNKLRHRHQKLRSKLQSKGTKSAKKLLRKRTGKEHRFVTDQNHLISKSIVARAKCTNSSIALENLKGITRGTKVRKPQRATLHNWSFFQLKTFIQYKARLVGIEVILVNPARTSTTCPKCGHYNRYNRKDRDHFICKQCGYAEHADYVAALNIASKAAVAINQPNVLVD